MQDAELIFRPGRLKDGVMLFLRGRSIGAGIRMAVGG
jgi:hypothetical protein